MRVEQVDFITVPTRDVTLSFWEPERGDLPFVANTAEFAVRVADVAEARAELEAKSDAPRT